MSTKSLGRIIKNELKWMGFVLPFILILLVILYYPIFQAFYGSLFFVKEMANVFGSEFVGLDNYRMLFADKRLVSTTYVTFALMGWSLMYIPIAFIIAYAVNSIGKKKLQSAFRIAFFAPYVIPGVAIIMIFQVFLQTNAGVLNTLLSMMSGTNVEIGWLSDPSIARLGVSIISNYSTLPYGIIICMAGLQTIPSELIEAAEIDGANAIQKLTRIVIPNMKGIFTFLLITQVIWGFQRITDLLIVALGQPTGAPGGSLQSIMMLIYQLSFFWPEPSTGFGKIFALTVFLFLVIMLVTLINLFLTRKRRDS